MLSLMIMEILRAHTVRCIYSHKLTTMATRLNINRIMTDTRDWICKVQIVEISRPRISPEKKIRFQNLILEDEEEVHIRAVIYGDDIEEYADKLTLMDTYLISAANVKVSSTSYSKPIHKFYWILDKKTILEHITPTNALEKTLPPPTKLNITSFDDISHMLANSTTEIDILAIVVRCGSLKHAGRNQNKCREITIYDNHKNHFLLTLWGDFGEIEGNELEARMEEDANVTVILGRSIGISTYQGLSLQTRFNSTIRIDPTYPQALQLIKWAQKNKDMLLRHASERLSTSSSSALMVSPGRQQITDLAEISSPACIVLLNVKAQMFISNELQDFCVLECSGCKQKKRTKERRDFECTKCNRRTTLVPRCIFQVDLIDGTGSDTASISGELGEKIISMKAEDIFDITCVKRQLLPINHVHEMLSNKLFHIQLRKSSWGNSNNPHTALSVLSYVEKDQVPLPSITERNSKKAKAIETNEGEIQTSTTSTSTTMLKIEPPTPTKKM